MADTPREPILDRLAEIAGALSGVVRAGRNLANLDPASDSPAVSISGGEEEVQERGAARGSRPSTAPHIVVMTADIVISVAGPPATIETTAHGILSALIKAILEDAILKSLIMDDEMGYEGLEPRLLTDGSRYIWELHTAFSFAYVLLPARL